MLDLKQALSHVYWIGGSPCAGKTSIARKLAEDYQLTYYKCDDCYEEHMARSTPNLHPTMYEIIDLTWNQAWSTRFCSNPVNELIDHVVRIYEEQFQLIVEDLLKRPKSAKILVEGAALLPELAAPLLLKPNQAIWVVPTPEFQLKHYAKREWIHDVLKNYPDPEHAFSNWMKRVIGFAEKILKSTGKLQLNSILVDGASSINQNYEKIKEFFSL